MNDTDNPHAILAKGAEPATAGSVLPLPASRSYPRPRMVFSSANTPVIDSPSRSPEGRALPRIP